MSSRPWTSQPFWLVFACVYYAAVALLAGQWWTPASVLYALGIVLFMTVGENAAKDIRDWDNDSAANRRTMVVAIGPSRAAGLSLLGCFGGAAAFLALLWSHPTLPAWSRAAGTGLMTYFLARAVAYTSKLRRTFEKLAARALHIGYIRTFLVFNTVIILGLSGNLATSLLLEGRPPALAAHDPARSAGDDHVHGRIGANP
jgi:4-hydroxybenzoate polyprenyltransferase